MLVRKIKNVEHKVYSNEEEFRQYCPNENLTRNWRDGTEGSWVTTDDGQICQVLRRGELKNSQSTGVCNYYVRTAIGTFRKEFLSRVGTEAPVLNRDSFSKSS